MKNIWIFALLFCFLAGDVMAKGKQDNRSVRSLKGKSILVFSGYQKGGFVHKNRSASMEMFLKMGEEHKMRVDTTSNPAFFTSENLKKYDAVVFANTNNRVFSDDSQREALKRFIQKGGGYLGIHSAADTEKEWDWYVRLAGGAFIAHPPFQSFTVRVTDTAHPSMQATPKERTVKDELYLFERFNQDVRILSVSDFEGVDFPEKIRHLKEELGPSYPNTWCNDFEGSRQWVTSLGHSPEDYSDPLFIRMVTEGLKWILAR